MSKVFLPREPAREQQRTTKALFRSRRFPVGIWLGSRTVSIFSSKKKVDPLACESEGAVTSPARAVTRTSRRLTAASSVVLASLTCTGANAEDVQTAKRATTAKKRMEGTAIKDRRGAWS
jgi:hypothetical protein